MTDEWDEAALCNSGKEALKILLLPGGELTRINSGVAHNLSSLRRMLATNSAELFQERGSVLKEDRDAQGPEGIAAQTQRVTIRALQGAWR
jgi:hypothetical protein